MAFVTTHVGYIAPERAERPRLMARFLNALVESRLRAAEREVRRYQAHFGPTTLAEAGLARISLAKADMLPFNL